MNTDTMQLTASPFGAESIPTNLNPANVPQNVRRTKSGPGFFARAGGALDRAVTSAARVGEEVGSRAGGAAVVAGLHGQKAVNGVLAATAGGLAGGLEKTARGLRKVETGARARQARAQEALADLLGSPEEQGVLTPDVV